MIAADQLLELSERLVTKRATREPELVNLDDLRVEHDYQRPPDREKIREIVEHLKAGGKLPPIKVNERDDGSRWITDGQHRAAAAAICGLDTVLAVVSRLPSWAEPGETGIVAKDSGRIPAGDPRRGRIHPGEWTKENNPAVLREKLKESGSHVERAVVAHRLGQVKGEHAVSGRLSDKEEKATRAALAAEKKRATKAGSIEEAEADEMQVRRRRSRAEEAVLGHGWGEKLVRDALDKHPEMRAATAKLMRAEKKQRSVLRATFDVAYGTPEAEAVRQKMLKARQERLKAANEWSDIRERLTGRAYGTHYEPEVVRETLGVDLDAHMVKHQAKIDREYRKLLLADAQTIASEAAREAEQHKAKLDAHRAAGQTAKDRAREAKGRKPIFEKQVLSGQFMGDLKRHQGRLRAVFLEDSPLEDGVAYCEYGKPLRPAKGYESKVSAYVDPVAHGAYVQEMVGDGKGMTPQLMEAGRDILYNTEPLIHRGKTPTITEVAAHIERALDQHGASLPAARVQRAARHLAKLVTTTKQVESWQPAAREMFRTFAELPAEHEPALVARLRGMGGKVDKLPLFFRGDYHSWASEKLKGAHEIVVDLGGGKRIRYVPRESLAGKQATRYAHTFTTGPVSPQKLAAIRAKRDAGAKDGAPKPARETAAWDHLAYLLEHQWPKTPVSFEHETDAHAKPRMTRDELAGALKGKRTLIPLRASLAQHFYTDAGRYLIDNVLTHEREKKTVNTGEQQGAPLSERGGLTIEGMAPADAVKTLKRLKLTSGLTPEVPYNIIYRGERRHGRVLSHHEDYVSGEHSPTARAGLGIFHGFASDAAQANPGKYMQRIIDDGGLQSIAERRRLGRAGAGISEKGDAGSGIDDYMFTNTADGPAYGHRSVVFHLKPSVLKRRDVAFAPRDFGGGHDREPKYTAHAKTLGLPHFRVAPHHEARQKHLDKHAGKNPQSELLLKHEIPWEDIHALYVHHHHHDEIHRMIQRAKRQGKVPADLKVIKHGHGPEHRLSSLIAAETAGLHPDGD